MSFGWNIFNNRWTFRIEIYIFSLNRIRLPVVLLKLLVVKCLFPVWRSPGWKFFLSFFKVSRAPEKQRGRPCLAERTTAADRSQSSHPTTPYHWGATGKGHFKLFLKTLLCIYLYLPFTYNRQKSSCYCVLWCVCYAFQSYVVKPLKRYKLICGKCWQKNV